MKTIALIATALLLSGCMPEVLTKAEKKQITTQCNNNFECMNTAMSRVINSRRSKAIQTGQAVGDKILDPTISNPE